MTIHFERSIDRLKERVVGLSQRVEQQVRDATAAFIERDKERGAKVEAGDAEIDQSEVDLEEECLKVLALHQPVAQDLRFIVAVLKINHELQLIGDFAVSIARRAKRLTELPPVELPPDLKEMAKESKLVLRKSLLGFLDLNTEIARSVIRAHTQIDDVHRRIYRLVLEEIRGATPDPEPYLLYLTVAKRFELIADSAANISEDVLYMVNGEILRHRRDRLEP